MGHPVIPTDLLALVKPGDAEENDLATHGVALPFAYKKLIPSGFSWFFVVKLCKIKLETDSKWFFTAFFW